MDRVELYSGGFPVTTTTFNFLQDAYGKAIKALTALGGNTFILEGVQVIGSNVTNGAIVYNGELLPFEGGVFNNTVSIYEDVQEVAYNQDSDNDGNLDLKRAYISRYAKCGTGGLESFNFNLLKRFTPLTQISMPIGLISMWSGAITDIPQGWVLCNGANGTPNLRDRFIVGAGGAYNVGITGGQSEVVLSENQMPLHNHTGSTGVSGSHKHTGSTYAGGSHKHTGSTNSSGNHRHKLPTSQSHDGYGRVTGGSVSAEPVNQYTEYDGNHSHSLNINNSGSHSHTLNMNDAGNHTHTLTTNNKGSGQAHENRPPYYALAYIMFKGL